MAETIGKYEILKKIAAGGMAEVYLAKHVGLGGFERLVCIKRILPHLGEQDDFVTMFHDEARIAAHLNHPNIAQIYDIGKHEDSYYIAMEYVRGEDLRRIYNAEVANGRAMPLEPAAQIAMYAAAALDHAHRQSTIDGRPMAIVHRDISPQNILVTYDGHVKIVDFGVAKATIKMNETRSGVLKGKYSYMSPEQASGDPIDARTDLFALAITMYEVTTGTRLFKRENEIDTLQAVIACDIKPPHEVLPGYDLDLEKIILKALSHDPDDRYSGAADMEQALEKYLINKGHPTNSSSLGAYMQNLFAERLADELLFGGQPWSETHTPNRAPDRKRRPRGKPKATTAISNSASAPTAVDYVDAAWRSGKTKSKRFNRLGRAKRSSWDNDSGSMSTTYGGDLEQTELGHPMETGRSTKSRQVRRSSLRTHRQRLSPQWISVLALSALFIGVGAGLAFVFSTGRIDTPQSVSGPLTIDSEPRNARVVFVGMGAIRLNKNYHGHRTPFTVTEGIPIAASLRARFIKDGFDIKEVALPTLVANVLPPTLFVELKSGKEGSENGTLMLLSAPSGADVWVDGHRIPGVTPLTDIRVRGGEMHRIEFRKHNYETRWETRYLEPGARIFVEVNLFEHGSDALTSPEIDPANLPQTKAPKEMNTAQNATKPVIKKQLKPEKKQKPKKKQQAFLNVTAPMKLRVSIDNRYKGHTPIRRLVLSAGMHKIKLESKSDGFRVMRKIRLEPNRTTHLDYQPHKGKLAINATPWAWVQVGTASPTETPVRLDVFEGEYRVRFECPDGRKRTQIAVAVAGRTENLTMNCRSN